MVSHVQQLILIHLNLLLQSFEDFEEEVSRRSESIGVGQKRSNFMHLGLIVQQFSFLFVIINRSELSPDYRVPNSDSEGLS